jgi:hypothetical protein
MTYLRHKYCQSAFKAILFVIGLTFFVAQASFKFYHFASFPVGESFTRARSHGSIERRTKDFLNYNKQTKISLVLDKRYDFKHVFISPAPLLRLSVLPIENFKCFFTPCHFISAGVSQVIFMRGPPCLDTLPHMV